MPLRTNTSTNHKPAIFNKMPINQQSMIAEVNYLTWVFFQFMQLTPKGVVMVGFTMETHVTHSLMPSPTDGLKPW